MSRRPATSLRELNTCAARGGHVAAVALFRRAMRADALDATFAAWIEAGYAAFAWEGSGTTSAAALKTARLNETAAELLLARGLFAGGHQACALAVVRAVVQREPTAPEANFLLCVMLLNAGDGKAQPALQFCLDHLATPSDGWSDVGRAFLEHGQRKAALVCFARGTPSFALAMQRGLIARDLGRLAEARQFFAEAAEFDPSSARAWFLLGTCAQDAGDLAAAQAAYRQVLTLDPARAEAAVNLGTVLQDGGDLDGAKAAYGQAVRRRADTFGRVAQALATSRKGELWLDLAALRRSLAG